MTSPKQDKVQDKESGAVLLTTLLLMAVMAAIMVAIVDDIRYSTRRTMNVQSAEQLAWFERGGEDFARIWLTNLNDDTQTDLAHIINANEPIVLPLDQGQLSVRIRDGRNCYNINQLANEKTKAVSLKNFSQFLQLLDFDNIDAEILAASIQDWVDADGIPNAGGAEGLSYANLTPAYHAANTLMVDISELREVQGINEALYQQLRPFVCARSDSKPNRININTLTPEQAPLLAALFGGTDSFSAALSTARAVIARRTVTGYVSVDEVWDLQIVQELELKGSGKSLLDIRTDRISLDITVQVDDQTRARRIVFKLGGEAGVELVSRRLVD